MELDKNSRTADAIANLYRAALYLARGSEKMGLEFLTKAQVVLGRKINVDLKQNNSLILAEKILDEYKRLKNEATIQDRE